MKELLRPSHGIVNVAPITIADAGGDRPGSPQHSAPTMAPTTVAARSAHRYITIVPKDAIAEAVEQFDRQLDAPHRTPVVPGELQEWEDWAASGVTLFRHVTAQLGLPSTQHIPTRLLSPAVRAALCDLRDALEREAAEQAKR